MMRKIGALVLVVMMVAAMSATAFAVDMDTEGGVIGEFETPDIVSSQNDTVVIHKEITAYNPESGTVNAPTITYNYTIGAASVTEGTSITDNASRHNQIDGANVTATVAVKTGVGTPTITGTDEGVLAITPADQLAASEYGTANRFDLTVDFSSVDWTTAGSGAGVYRYEITEATDVTTKNNSGIAEGTLAKTLFMDVYVNGSGEIYGYVLFTENASIDGSTSEDDAAAAAGKVEGFVDDVDNHEYTSTDTSTADKYYTFNLDLAKIVENDAYAVSTHHQFPFHVTLDNATVTAAVLPIMTVGENATQTELSAAAIGTGASATNWSPTIASGATISYVGIPCGTTVTIYETNDVTGVTYKSVSTNADTDADAKVIGTGDDSNVATVDCNAAALTAASENHTSAANKVVTFTNTLLEISPTGITLRVAPYLLMMAAGITLLVVFMKKRRPAEEE